MTIAVQIIAIIFMVTLIFIGIWSFVIANKAYNQLRYKNYLLEKINNQLAIMTENSLIDIKKNVSTETTSTDDIKENSNDDISDFTEEKLLENIPPLFELKDKI